MRRALAVAALTVAAAALAAIVLVEERTSPGPRRETGRAPGQRPVSDAERLERLVAARARALGRGRTIPATAVAARRRLDRRDARRAAAMGARDIRAEVLESSIGGRRARLRVALSYGVRGIAGRFTSQRVVHAVRRSGRWRVRRVAGVRRQPPWEVAAFRRVRSPHFVILAPKGVDPAAGALPSALEDGYARMEALLRRGRLRRRYLVVVAATTRQAVELTAAIRGVGSLAALTDTEVREQGPERRVVHVASQRLLVVWPEYLAAGPRQGPTVVVHELTHAVLAPVTSGRTPGWLLEGIALFVSGDRRTREAADLLTSARGRGAPTLRTLDAPDAIAGLSGERQADAYAYASAAAFHIADHHGRRRLLGLLRAFNDPAVEDTDDAVRKVLGISLRRLERDVRAGILARARGGTAAP